MWAIKRIIAVRQEAHPSDKNAIAAAFSEYSLGTLEQITKVGKNCQSVEELLALYLIGQSGTGARIGDYLDQENVSIVLQSLDNGLFQGKARHNIIIHEDSVFQKTDRESLQTSKMALAEASKQLERYHLSVEDGMANDVITQDQFEKSANICRFLSLFVKYLAIDWNRAVRNLKSNVSNLASFEEAHECLNMLLNLNLGKLLKPNIFFSAIFDAFKVTKLATLEEIGLNYHEFSNSEAHMI